MAFPDRESQVEEICQRLAKGNSLIQVCKAKDMPCARTVQNWMNEDEKISAQITRAREVGYLIRADKAVEDAKNAEDAAKGRLAFDAERWYLGKLSKAFSDKIKHVGGDEDDPPIRVTQIELVPLEGPSSTPE